MRKLFVSGIGTDVGKTIVAAVLTEALEADYWKPIQAGSVPQTDSYFVRSHISNPTSVIHPEAYLLREPMSPHAAATLENVRIELSTIKLPQTTNHLIIEGAGGLLVPLNEANLVIDLISELGAEVVLVVKHYLGSINHTLLSIEALKNRKLPIAGIIFNGDRNLVSEEIILKHHAFKFVGYVGDLSSLNKDSIREAAISLKGI